MHLTNLTELNLIFLLNGELIERWISMDTPHREVKLRNRKKKNTNGQCRRLFFNNRASTLTWKQQNILLIIKANDLWAVQSFLGFFLNNIISFQNKQPWLSTVLLSELSCIIGKDSDFWIHIFPSPRLDTIQV